jgi:hypothetical protein
MTYYTTHKAFDGVGAQYQRIIQTYIYCKSTGLQFVYTPFDTIEHNYQNDPNFINQQEELVNLYNNLPLVKGTQANPIGYGKVMPWFESNIDMACNSEHMKFIKKCFWENKDRDVYKNNKKNIAIHIRRSNTGDKGTAGERITTPDEYYLNIMKNIRNKYQAEDLQFHIYSQGNLGNFDKYKEKDVVLHIDEAVNTSFICMVGADILVTSPSSFSYIAALISDGEIYYKRFWHKPCTNWIICG